MNILFIDESKPPTDPDKLTAHNTFFVLSGLVIPEHAWKSTCTQFQQILDKYKVEKEIKWRYFSPQNKDERNSLKHLDQIQKNTLRTDILKMLGANKALTIISVICNLQAAYKTSYINTKTDAYDFCYKKLVERFQYYLQYKETKNGDKVMGIIVCDHRGRQDDVHLRQMHDRMLSKKEAYCSDLTNIIETVFFVPSDKSMGIQLVDMVAGSISRYISARDDNFYRHIKSIVRRNDKGEAKGFGIVFVPPTQKKTPR